MSARRAVLALSFALGLGAAPSVEAAPYTTRGTCAGYPRLDLVVPAGWCVALLADAASGLVFPRRVLEVAPGRFWLVDMGSWEPNRGRLLQFELPTTAATPVTMKVIADQLDRPQGLVLGADGRVYLGEAGRIRRTPSTLSLALETIIDGLPADGAHPLKELAFGAPGRLFVNVGSSSDACCDDAGALPMPCPDVAGARPRAAVYEAVLGGTGFTVQSFKPYATGLRNSLALAWVAPGVLLQGETRSTIATKTRRPKSSTRCVPAPTTAGRIASARARSRAATKAASTAPRPRRRRCSGPPMPRRCR